jgi:hypothetical protein
MSFPAVLHTKFHKMMAPQFSGSIELQSIRTKRMIVIRYTDLKGQRHNIIVRYHTERSMKLNACILLLAHMFYL